MNTCSYLSMADQASSLSEITLPGPVETMLEKIYGKHKLSSITVDTRRRLSCFSEEMAFDALRKVYNTGRVKATLDSFINHLLDQAVTVNGSPRRSPGESPVQTPSTPGKKSCRPFQEMSLLSEAPSLKLLRREDNGGSPELVALGELEFKKVFLLLSYIAGKPLAEVLNAEVVSAYEIRRWKDMTMVDYEPAVWLRLGQHYCSEKEPRVTLEWDSGKTLYYQCHVALDGSHRLKGPLMENTGTLLHKVLGDDNVLTVRFADVPGVSTCCNDLYAKYKEVAKKGIMIGLRRYQFFVYKDGGKEGKKKDLTKKGVKCYFIRTDSTASVDMRIPYIFSEKSIHEARRHFMHVHTSPSMPNYMARFSLILSKTKTLEIDVTGINFEPIDDIHCHDQDDNDVLDKNGKPCIHSDGTGYISEDLARMCPTDIFKGRRIISDNKQNEIQNIEAQGTCGKEPPLLIQFRMFKDGYAVKGTFLLNKKLPARTVQVRPSMIKVYKDLNLSNFSTCNSLEVVTTSNRPKRAIKLSRNLVALLSYGGVPNDFFLDILHNTLEESKTVFNNTKVALKAASNYGGMDDNNIAQMISSNIPLDEPYLKHRLSILLMNERKDLKAGRLTVTDSYYLMGTVDPTGELKEDEVCVIMETGQISGDVLVYRNPGLHFGDIHLLKATYVKALEDYIGDSKYAVFFPQKGPRSLGDEIAGGDFDGDMYFVSRNPKLLENFKPSEPWVSSSPPNKIYTGRTPSEYSPEELEEELFKMFIKKRFQDRSVIGTAADSWLAIMDGLLTLGDERTEEKARRKEKILKLIDIYYDALDASKKGAKVDLPFDVKVDKFPHYMEHDHKEYFKSTSILGLIYDIVESQKNPPLSKISKLQCFEDEPVPESHVENCQRLHQSYRNEMSQAINSDEDAPNEVIERYKQDFYGAAGFEESKISLEKLYLKALALYNVTYDYAIKLNNVGSCGFAWKVAGPVLCKFYREKTEEKSIVITLSVLKKVMG